MKWLAIQPGPNFSVADVHTGWVEALRELGEQVVSYNLDARLTFYDVALREDGPGRFVRMLPDTESVTRLAVNGIYADLYRFRPDVLLVISAMFVPIELMDEAKRNGTRVVVVHTESPYEDDRQLVVGAHADMNLLNDPVNIERFAELGPAWYVPHAYRPSIHHPGPPVPELACELAFVGTGFPSRVRFLEGMNLDGLDVLLGGNWRELAEDSPLRKYVAHDPAECLDNAATADVYRSAKVGLNLYRREANDETLIEGMSLGPREVEMAACGMFFLRDHRPESDGVLSMLPTFDSPEEAGELLRYYLDHPAEREKAARAAREAIEDRTFVNNAAALLRCLSRRST